MQVRSLDLQLRKTKSRRCLAEEIARHVRGTEAWRNRLQGYVLLYRAHVLSRSGDTEDAEAALTEARRQWDAGCDPEGLLDPGVLLGQALM